jgi:hypothetical protein
MYSGVRQGGVLSPLLFNMITNEAVMRETKRQESEDQKLWYI